MSIVVDHFDGVIQVTLNRPEALTRSRSRWRSRSPRRSIRLPPTTPLG